MKKDQIPLRGVKDEIVDSDCDSAEGHNIRQAYRDFYSTLDDDTVQELCWFLDSKFVGGYHRNLARVGK